MKLCANCGSENEDAATRCRRCSAELVTPKPVEEQEPDARFEKVAVLDSEVQAELLDGVLSGQGIPHIMQSYHDSAYDGLFQSQMGWGHVSAPARFRGEILATLESLKRQAEHPDAAPTGPAE